MVFLGFWGGGNTGSEEIVWGDRERGQEVKKDFFFIRAERLKKLCAFLLGHGADLAT